MPGTENGAAPTFGKILKQHPGSKHGKDKLTAS